MPSADFMRRYGKEPLTKKLQAPTKTDIEMNEVGMKATDLDPRPDLADDHRDWVAVLGLAWHQNRELWGLLHGFRCGGARLSKQTTTDGKEMFKLDYTALLDVWDKETLVREWLNPNKEAIKRLFIQAARLMASTTGEMKAAG